MKRVGDVRFYLDESQEVESLGDSGAISLRNSILDDGHFEKIYQDKIRKLKVLRIKIHFCQVT